MTPWLAQAVCVLLLVSTSSQQASDVTPTAPAAVSITMTPDKLDFGTQPVGKTGQPKTATLANVGKVSVTILDVTASGIDFSANDHCQGNLAPGANCTIDVTFTPAITGPRMGTVVITASDPAHPLFLVLTGIGE